MGVYVLAPPEKGLGHTLPDRGSGRPKASPSFVIHTPYETEVGANKSASDLELYGRKVLAQACTPAPRRLRPERHECKHNLGCKNKSTALNAKDQREKVNKGN